ncbi:hypothetical protein PSTG_20102 [Puccinia striiformis f. sp. tritici PST-78]|uniref:SSD domain-containing protein n=1 Tax=Puccinia striiformis f. sp. tritici PST-78 TaxID=1165861 RepID=A0A0L0UHL1_9BASI|nr:hypothetical protein PSTG_20102 [Puccinia striiformis f. sp. tritici PST-78]
MLLSISNVFIKNPVLTTVCTIVIILLGAIALPLLPLAKLPDMAPKQVQVTTNFVGSDAQTAVNNVTTVLERQINGTEQVIYMNSTTDNTGTSTINVYSPWKWTGTSPRFSCKITWRSPLRAYQRP